MTIEISDELAASLEEYPLALPVGSYCAGPIAEAVARAAERRIQDEALVAQIEAARQDENHHVLSMDEAADYLKVSLNTIRRMIEDGRLPVTKVGRSVRIPYVAVAALGLNRRPPPG